MGIMGIDMHLGDVQYINGQDAHEGRVPRMIMNGHWHACQDGNGRMRVLSCWL